MTPVWKVNLAQVLAITCLGIVIGIWLKKKLPILERLSIPTPIVGGLLYALVILVLRDRYLNLEMDLSLRDVFNVGFCTSIGLSARLRLIRIGGVQMVVFLAIASVGAILQNLLGIGLAKMLGLSPLLGILAGSVALAGGPATSLAFGSTFEKMGIQGATTLAIAAATFGVTVASLIGGYLGDRLVRRHKLVPSGMAGPGQPAPGETESGGGSLLNLTIVIGIAMGLGSLISMGMARAGIILPGYIGAMMVAAVFRNVNDHFGLVRIAQRDVDVVGRIMLYLFIVMALLGLRLQELAHLALPLVIMLTAQVVLCWLMCVALSFPLMGRDYEAAVMSSGFCGFMLGITANAVACMEELVEKYGPAPQAFLIVPVVGQFLIDLTNSVIITTMANIVR